MSDGSPASSDQPADYAVGYKKPPHHTQFRKGQSGNRKGRPKRAVDMKAAAIKVFGEPVSIRVNGKIRKVTTLEAALMNLRTDLIKGDHKAMRLAVTIMDMAGIISLPEEPEAEEKELSAEERTMLQQHLAAVMPSQSAEAPKA